MNIPIAILVEKTARVEGPAYISENFINNGFFPIWCSYEIHSLIEIKDRVEYFVFILPSEMTDKCRQACNYLRDIGIDEEKSIFICGNRTMQDEAKKLIPSMLILGSYDIEIGELKHIAGQMHKELPNAGKRVGCLIIDRDKEYSSKLLLALNQYCDTVVSNGTPAETSPFLDDATLLILSVDFEMDFLEWGKLRGMLMRRSRKGYFYIVYMAKNNERRKEVINTLSEVGICISKEMDFLKNANYIVNRYIKRL